MTANNPNQPAASLPAAPSTASRLRTVLLLTAGFMFVEAIGGWLSGSLALVADAGHMLTDVGALALAMMSARMAQRPADHRRTYGYLRLEILAALVNGVVLAALSAWIIFEAIRRLRSPHVIEGPLFAGVALAGLIVNLIALRLLKHESHGNLNTRAAYLHVLGDLLGSVGALLAAGIVILTGWTYADPIVSVLISLLIIAGSWRLLRESVEILLEAAPSHIPLQDVERRMRGVEGVIAVHDLHVWTLTSGVVAMSGHVVVPDLASHPRVLTAVQREVRDIGIGHVTIQVECLDQCIPDAEGPLARGHAGPAGSHSHPHPHSH
jgi:cobalt-zinc-cadmium efflux system protein